MPDDVQVIVVGSGFGGAVTACRLSQAGMRVLLLERGRRYERDDFPALPDDDRLLPDLKRWRWSEDQGLWDIQDLGEIVSIQAAGYGGGSLIYANVHLRPPHGAFGEQWPLKFQGEALEPYFDLAASMLDVSPIDNHAEQFAKTKHLDTAVTGLNRQAFHPPLAVSHRDHTNAFGEAIQACDGCARCCTGCPRRSKHTLDLTYLSQAEQNGVQVLTQCEVKNIVQGEDPTGKPSWSVEYLDHLGARLRKVSAPTLFLCAGSLHSSRLLARARLRAASQPVQQRVGVGYFPNADATGVVYDTASEVFPSKGPCITTTVASWDAAGKSFFLLQDGGYAPELARLSGLLRAPLWTGRNRLTDGAPLAKDVTGKDEPRPATPRPGVALLSPLDGLLDALGDGVSQKIASDSVRESWPKLLTEVARALILPSTVESTVERCMKAQYQRSWVRHVLAFASPLARGFRALQKWLIRVNFGPSEALAGRALSSVLNLADLDRVASAKNVLGYDDTHASRRLMLLAMGSDPARGVLRYDHERDRMTADLDLYHAAPQYANQERLMADVAGKLGGELRVSPAWAYLGKPLTVHSQGGCRMSTLPADGVTDDSGQVHGCPGLYVMDGALLCESLGVNPSATILAISELNALEFIRRSTGNRVWPVGDDSPGAAQYLRQAEDAKRWRRRAEQGGWSLRPAPPTLGQPSFDTPGLGVKFKEKMEGFCAPVPSGKDPRFRDSVYRRLESAGRPAGPVVLELSASTENLSQFFEDFRHRMQLTGTIRVTLPGRKDVEVFDVSGFVDVLVPRYKGYGLGRSDPARGAQRRAAKGYVTHVGSPKPGAERLFRYHLSFDQDRWRFAGYKRVRQDPGLDAWRDTSSLFMKIGTPKLCSDGSPIELGERDSVAVRAAGVVHVDLTRFLYHQLPSFEVTGTSDPARVNWALAKFAAFFFGTLQRVYVPEIAPALQALQRPIDNGVRHEPARRRT